MALPVLAVLDLGDGVLGYVHPRVCRCRSPARSTASRTLVGARRQGRGPLRSPLTSFANELAEAARRGRVTVELLSEDGGVAARAQATADLVPVEADGCEGA